MIDQFRKSFEALKELEKVDLMADDSYQEIFRIIKEKIIIPFVTLTIPVGQVLYRARLNENCSFNSKTDISYNKNLDKIEIGRANYFSQSTFYASHKEETAIIETSKSLKNRKIGTNEIITVGKWIVTNPIEVIPIFHDKEFQQKNETIRDKYLNFLKTNPLFTSEWTQLHLEFISNQFAKKVKCIDEYKISCAFFNIIKERKFTDGGVSGILFPTVEWEMNDVNIALTPECVDKHLSLNQVAEFKVNIENDKNGIIQIGTSDCLKFKMSNLIIKN